MSAKRWFFGIAIGVAGGALFLAWSFHRETRASDSARRALHARQPRLLVQLQRWKGQLAQAKQRGGELQASLVDIEAKRTAAPASQAATPTMHFTDRLKNDPAVQVHYFEMRRAELAVSYGPLIRALELTSEQAEKLLTATIEFESSELDARSIRDVEKGKAGSSAAIEAMRKKAKAELEAAQLATLGSERFQQLQDYERSRPARDMVGLFAGAAAVAGVPVTREQAEQLTQAVAEASAGFRAGGKVEVAQIEWAAVDAGAAALLSPAQLQLLARTDLTQRWTMAAHAALQAALADSRRK
jgi:hypothetical protein